MYCISNAHINEILDRREDKGKELADYNIIREKTHITNYTRNRVKRFDDNTWG